MRSERAAAPGDTQVKQSPMNPARFASGLRVVRSLTSRDSAAHHHAHALKLGMMSVEAAAIALLPACHVIASIAWGLLPFRSRTRRVQSNGLETASILRESRRQSRL